MIHIIRVLQLLSGVTTAMWDSAIATSDLITLAAPLAFKTSWSFSLVMTETPPLKLLVPLLVINIFKVMRKFIVHS